MVFGLGRVSSSAREEPEELGVSLETVCGRGQSALCEWKKWRKWRKFEPLISELSGQYQAED